MKNGWDGETRFEKVCNGDLTLIRDSYAMDSKYMAMGHSFLGMNASSASGIDSVVSP